MGLKTNTKWEDLLYGHCIAAGLPKPERDIRFLEDRKFRGDLVWQSHKLIVEVQGGIWAMASLKNPSGKMGHSSGRGITRDCEKAILAQLAGWMIFAVTDKQIRSGQALNWIEEALRLKS